MLAGLTLLALLYQSHTINLYRSAPVATPRYWDVEDTYLDAKDPDSVLGGGYTILGGPGKTTLIRFGDLNRVLGPHKHVIKATLFLTPSGGDVPLLHSIGRVLQPWGEGPMVTISAVLGAVKVNEKPTWAATYKQRRSGFYNWSAPGAAGAQDVAPISGAQLAAEDKEYAINGLEAAVQTMLDKPYGNNGFALLFDSNTEFFSSTSPNGQPRLVIEYEDVPTSSGSNLSVAYIDRTPNTASTGQGVTYTAHIKNVGDQPSKPFSAAWFDGERPTSSSDVTESVAPGSETTLMFKQKSEPSATDHRTHPIGVSISPTGSEVSMANKALEIDENAIPVNVVVRPDAAKALTSSDNPLGSRGVEDWVQAQVKLWNDTYAAQSHFSFAPEGALERIRVNSITIGPGSDGAVVDAGAAPLEVDLPFMKSLSRAAGLMDGAPLEIQQGEVHIQGSSTRAHTDLYPGLMGYGDTRWDGDVLRAVPLAYDPVFDTNMQGPLLKPTDLLSATDIGFLNANLGKVRNKPSDTLLPMAKAVLLRVMDLQGKPLPNLDLLFFQSTTGGFPQEGPTFAAKTGDSGIAVLNSRGSGGSYGELTPDGSNGVLMVQAKVNGVLETGWLPAWQLTDSNRRGATMVQLRLNLPDSQIDTTTNLATDRIITDSAGDLPAKLVHLTDGSEDTECSLPDAANSWVEIDLGRDRSIAEVDLVTSGKAFWKQFNIVMYTTGQTVASDALTWASELDWDWTLQNRHDAGKTANSLSVAYRGMVQRVRYIRIINKSGGSGSLTQIRVAAARISP